MSPDDPTPADHQRTTGGHFRWQPPTVQRLQHLLTGYEVLEMLGAGGMGAVYKARQVSLDRLVAIKILPPEVADDEMNFAERFRNEARTMAKMSHPGIVSVFDFGETSEGQLYIVMEFIDGTDVARMILAQGRLPAEHALAITAHVCDALAYAHAQGVVHRDIKPANILINQAGQVKVADFGLAKAADAGQSGLTKTNMAMGTPDFVAPEALMGGLHLDGRADLYAVGVMLYQMLTGNVPRGSFRMPSATAATDPRFDKIIVKAMEMDREMRYQTAVSIRQDLDVILTTPHVKAGGPGSAAIPKQAAASARPQRPEQRPQKPSPANAPAVKSGGRGWLVPAAIAAVVIMGGVFLLGNRDVSAPVVVEEPAKRPPPVSAPVAKSPPVKTPEVSKIRPAPAAPVAAKQAAVPAPAPQRPAPVVAVPSPAITASTPSPPVTAPLPDPAPSELDLRLGALETGFQAAVERDVGTAFKSSLATLDKSYLGALDRSLAAATAGGKLEEAIALREEKQRIERGEGVPSEVDESTQSAPPPEAVRTLRKTYRDTAAQHEAAKVKGMQPLYDKYDQALAAVQTELTKEGKLDDAMRVKTVREEIATKRGQSIPAPQPVVAVAAVSVPAPASVDKALLEATKDKPFTNTLGMKFVPVPGTEVLFCIHETRYKDYVAFAAEAPGLIARWKNQTLKGIAPKERPEDHPVVIVDWGDAQSFCTWLSKKEGKRYRLPADEEWSFAVGIGRDEKRKKGDTPAMLPALNNVFPWGEKWPPPKDSGNYGDENLQAAMPGSKFIEGYDDGHPTTAPVMSFKPNRLGIYDLGGNVGEWCEDWHSHTQQSRVLRGNTWKAALDFTLHSSLRTPAGPTVREDDYGFRVVLDTCAPASTGGAVSKSAVPPIAPPVTPPPAPATAAKSDFTNTLGMKFVKVPGTEILMCIHETRRQDYAVHAAEVPGVDEAWKNQKRDSIPCGHEDNHPVVGVNWDEAQAFCGWLSKKEGKVYRLPTDEEWSFAVGLGRAEKRGKNVTPDMLHGKETTIYPWGGDYPPRTKDRSGNYTDSAYHEKWAAGNWIDGFTDGFATTAPVMSFNPNRLGIYDLGGNALEWVQDAWNAAQTERVQRGGSYFDHSDRAKLLASSRARVAPTIRHYSYGFRVVLETRGAPGTSGTAARPISNPPVTPSPAPATAAKSDFTNTLGMKFVKVPGTKTLFCIHQTRYKDYAVHAGETPGLNANWKKQTHDGFVITDRAEEHPVTQVSCENAQAFCAWLSQKEGKTYRLPTDREWSMAVGIGRDEKWEPNTTPHTVNLVPDEYPWGNRWPPPKGAGNLSDQSRQAKAPVGNESYIEGYDDGFPTTAPVMSFKPNRLGLYDLGTNVWEWCNDEIKDNQNSRVARGAGWATFGAPFILSSRRNYSFANNSNLTACGFRIVLETRD